MKNSLLASCLLALALTATASAQAAPSPATRARDGFGIGFMLGSPSGISGSLPMGSRNAVNAVLGYDLNHGANLRAQADYVWHRRDLIPVQSGQASVYFGPGAFTRLGGDASIGVRGVAGVDYFFQDAPVQVFLELGLGINVLPNTKSTGSGGLGVRYYF